MNDDVHAHPSEGPPGGAARDVFGGGARAIRIGLASNRPLIRLRLASAVLEATRARANTRSGQVLPRESVQPSTACPR